MYQQARFSAPFRTFAMDLRGWGTSGKPTESFTLGDMGRDILGLLAEQGVARGAIAAAAALGRRSR